MYLPAHFDETRIEVMRELMRARPLATLVAQCESGLVANHIPVQTLDEPAPWGCIRGHIARANPLWKDYRADTQALAIFQGPQAYISPSLYPSKQKTGEVVPTWNYAVVHASGTLKFIQDPIWLRSFVAGLTDTHETPRAAPWGIDDAPPAYTEKMLKLIVGFEFSISSIKGKWKVSQNRTQADREGVRLGLEGSVDRDARALAAAMPPLESPPVESPPAVSPSPGSASETTAAK